MVTMMGIDLSDPSSIAGCSGGNFRYFIRVAMKNEEGIFKSIGIIV
jgi:hypothetical protein